MFFSKIKYNTHFLGKSNHLINVLTTVPPTQKPEACWTKWFNRDVPGGTGDWETLEKLRKENPGKICHKPLEIQAVTAEKSIPAEETKQKFFA